MLDVKTPITVNSSEVRVEPTGLPCIPRFIVAYSVINVIFSVLSKSNELPTIRLSLKSVSNSPITDKEPKTSYFSGSSLLNAMLLNPFILYKSVTKLLIVLLSELFFILIVTVCISDVSQK